MEISWRCLFSQIALALVLSLSVLFLAHIYVSHLLSSKVDHSEVALDVATPGSPSESSILSRLSSEWSTFLLFKAAYRLTLLVLSLLSTSAVVYSIASMYTTKDLSFAKVLVVVPKVWHRLMITFLWAFLLVAYNNAVLLVTVRRPPPRPQHRRGHRRLPHSPPLHRRSRLDQRRLAHRQRRLCPQGCLRHRGHAQEPSPHHPSVAVAPPRLAAGSAPSAIALPLACSPLWSLHRR